MYRITCSHANHTGGTKSYRVWRIEQDRGASAMVAQWGKTSALSGVQARGGQVWIQFARTPNEARMHQNKKVAEKTPRDYRLWGVIVNQEFGIAEKDRFVKSVRQLFSHDDSRIILRHMGFPINDDGQLTEDPIVVDEPEQENTPAVETHPRPEAWGTW